MMRKKNSMENIESWLIANAKKGTIFYTNKKDNNMTSLASYHKRKIKTERLITITIGKQNLQAKHLLKVTLIN
jgi:hypothetical protein